MRFSCISPSSTRSTPPAGYCAPLRSSAVPTDVCPSSSPLSNRPSLISTMLRIRLSRSSTALAPSGLSGRPCDPALDRPPLPALPPGERSAAPLDADDRDASDDADVDGVMPPPARAPRSPPRADVDELELARKNVGRVVAEAVAGPEEAAS